MARCFGELPITAKVDRETRDFLDAEADRCGVTRAEIVRRLLDDYRDSRSDQLECPECGETLHLDPCP